MSKILCRLAGPSDFEVIQRMCRALFQYERDQNLDDAITNLEWPFTDYAENYFHQAITGQDGYQAFMAEADGQPVGYLIGHLASKLYLITNPIAELENMFVEADYRRTGAGTGLVQAFKQWAAKHSATRLRVGAYARNHPAQTFYRKNGFHDHEVVLEQSL